MSQLPAGLPGRVDADSANHLADMHNLPPVRDDSYASIRSSSNAPTAVGPIALDRMRSLLTARELDTLKSVDRFRYLSASQIEALHFTGHASGETGARIRRRVLERLTSAGMLVRLDRPIGGVRAGSGGFVYRLGPLGYRIVRDHASMSGRSKEPSATFLDHTLAVAQLAIDVMRAGSVDGSGVEVLKVEAEPDCWRSFQKGLGGRETLKPDLLLALGQGEYEDRWFCEIDRGTESTTAVARKCQTYLAYWRTGIEQQRHDVFPRVLWIVPNERRRTLLATTLRKTRDLNASELFMVTTVADALQTLIGGDS